jgi:hypothetical protein
MEIPRFPRNIAISNVRALIESRLKNPIVLWPEQVAALAGYMCWPNDLDARKRLANSLRSWSGGSPSVPPKLGKIQHQWLRVADAFHLHFDIKQGDHQKRRGGASLSKAITLAEANTKAWGTGTATFWATWKRYRDVAHLVTAAVLICVESRIARSQGPFGLSVNQILPIQMVMLMPELILAVGLEFERYGLSAVSLARDEPMLSLHTVWRIPQDVNVRPVPPPPRKLRPSDVAMLNARRSGNRGRANKPRPL